MGEEWSPHFTSGSSDESAHSGGRLQHTS
jgi:hypothetical protein